MLAASPSWVKPLSWINSSEHPMDRSAESRRNRPSGMIWAPSGDGRMRLRSHLLVLVAAALAPMVAVTAVLGVLFVDQVQDTFRSGAFARNRAFMSAIEAD